jgi:hypothetical protein
MARVLVVGPRWDRFGFHAAVLRTLQTLGIEAVPATLDGTRLSVVGQTFTANSTAARDFLNRFDATLVLERREISSTVSTLDQALNSWLTWNTNADKPVIYFAPNLGVARTTVSLPADFPIQRPNHADLANTAHLLDANTWTVQTDARRAASTRLGCEIRLHREARTVFVPCACAFQGNAAYFWRLDLSQHAALGANGEILAGPDFGDRAYPPDAVVAYRYRNRYFFPFLWERDTAFLMDRGTPFGISLFWLLYALKCVGVPARRQAVLCMEVDHPIEEKHNRPIDGQTRSDQYTIIEATYRWLASFCKETGLVIPCGFTNGGRSRTNAYHYYYVQTYPQARAINELLLREHAVLPCGVHDHTFTWGRLYGNFTRVGGGRHPYAAPHNVPVEYGATGQPWALVSEKVASSAVRNAPGVVFKDGFYNLGAVMSGSGATVPNLSNLCRYTADMVLADEVDEMRELGFADGHCGRHRYTNAAADSTGGEGYWRALIALGFRGIRLATDYAAAPSGQPHRNQVNPTVGRGWQYRGLHFVPGQSVDWFSVGDGCYGLYHTDTSDTAVGIWKLDLGGTDLADYATNANTRWKVFRRAMGLMTGLWLTMALFYRGTIYTHPQGWFGASVSDPTGRVDTGSDLKVNPKVEICRAMRAVQEVLSGYLRFGSPTDVMDLREAVG